MTYQDALAGRVSLPQQIYHITLCTYQRQPVFTCFATGRLIALQLKDTQAQRHALSLAWVIMPDHLHWLMQLEETCSLNQVLKGVKARSAQAVNRHLNRTGPLWQTGFHEHALRKEEDIKQIARYIIANPLRAKLVTKIGDYPLWDAVWL
ncbi:transposase [Oceanisphaera profunda]|uniref:Transposase n=1 Tax=Oceanisphaera profunda TaxID=1416627 RepID=A0A1Y0D1R8_9GAMM|nr:transposase [Oceanisphaera profunda]ART81284.1 transposase [Oceanisphaera profunda]